MYAKHRRAIDCRVESRPREFHPKPLLEPCGTLACHTAPIVRTATFTGVSISLAEVKIAPGIRWGTGNWGREGVKKLATARGCCGFGNADKLQA
jgi:hypothetical protein